MPIKKRVISFGLDRLEYKIKLDRRCRRVRLSVFPDGQVVVSGPPRTPVWLIERFVRMKTAWIFEKREHFQNRPQTIKPLDDQEDFLANKERARRLVGDRIAFFNKLYRQSFNKIMIRRPKTRWGSCSSRRNLSFNYRLIHLAPHLLDYIIVHELCHLLEMNHSARFWRQVERAIPDYQAARRELRGEGMVVG